MTPDQIVKVADHASTMSDRWLFIATLIIFLLSLGASLRWVVNHFSVRQDRLEIEIVKVREEHVAYVKDEGVKTSVLLSRCVEALEKIQTK